MSKQPKQSEKVPTKPATPHTVGNVFDFDRHNAMEDAFVKLRAMAGRPPMKTVYVKTIRSEEPPQQQFLHVTYVKDTSESVQAKDTTPTIIQTTTDEGEQEHKTIIDSQDPDEDSALSQQGNTERFDELTYEEQAKSITAMINNLNNAIQHHAQHAPDPDQTKLKCVKQVYHLLGRLLES